MSSSNTDRLSDWIRALPSRGRTTVSLEEIRASVRGSAVAHQSALRRLVAKGLLVRVRRGFFVVVPPEYAAIGSPPATWFIDDLMRYQARPYYVALLSAAALHGAAHQQPQVFQVMTNPALAPMTAGPIRIEFHRHRDMASTPTTTKNTPTGTLTVSTPEGTVFDLVRHVRSCGSISNVATVLDELAEVLDPALLRDAASRVRLPEIQRAGYLLELTGHADLARPLHESLAGRRVPLAPLRPGIPSRDSPRDPRWHLALNEPVEPDL